MTLALRYAVRSDVGLLREGNEDSAYAGPHLLAVADGMGGYEAGEVASAAVISTVAPLDRTELPPAELIDALASAVATAKQALRHIVDTDPAVGSMGTTLTAMLWSGGTAAVCHIGDSRAYLLRDGDLYQITRDHTFVQALVDQGRIRPDEVSTHPQRSLLLRALDGRTDADPDLSTLTAQAGDRYLLCSDGLPVAVSDEQILQALADVAEPNDAVLQLIDLAIRGGGPDNITCIVADVIDTAVSPLAPTRAALVAGAASGGGSNDTKPITKPMDGNDRGVTRLESVPASPPVPVNASAAVGQTTTPARGSTRPGRFPAVGASPDPVEPDDDEPRPGRRRLPVMTSVIALAVLLIAGGLFAGVPVHPEPVLHRHGTWRGHHLPRPEPAGARDLTVQRGAVDRCPAGRRADQLRSRDPRCHHRWRARPGQPEHGHDSQRLPQLSGRLRGGAAVGGRQAQAGD